MAATASAAANTVSFSGNRSEVISVEPDKNSGLDALYVVETSAGVSVNYRAASAAAAATVQWARFSSMGAAYAQEITDGISRNGNNVTLTAIEPDMGYAITEGTSTCYIWIADYSRHPFHPNSLSLAPDADCSLTTLLFDGQADRMVYYSITGRTLEIDRRISVSWNTLSWSDDNGRFETTTVTDSRAWVPTQFTVQSPLCVTNFSLTGDRFLGTWGRQITVTSASADPVAIDAHVTVTQTERDNSNEQKVEGVELGGSAPVEISFEAAVTDAAIFTEWQMSHDPEFNVIDYRSNDTSFDYTFRDMGTTYVRFTAANADASCDFVSDTYQIFVGESALICPNAFSPGGSEGVNDEWKVSYKSIVKFECHIFNKWGVKMAEFNDPSQGWDGKYKGKIVPAGVYYYVIKAEGADGKKYDRAGDINILNYR